MDVREAKVEDAGGLARILQSVAWLWAGQQPLDQLETAARRFLESVDALPTSTVLIAEDGNVAVGFIAMHLHPSVLADSEGYVSHLFVAAGSRGQGVGRILLTAAEQEAATHGCSRLLLYISRFRLAYKRRFYQKAGWQEREDAALFSCDLTRLRQLLG